LSVQVKTIIGRCRLEVKGPTFKNVGEFLDGFSGLLERARERQDLSEGKLGDDDMFELDLSSSKEQVLV